MRGKPKRKLTRGDKIVKKAKVRSTTKKKRKTIEEQVEESIESNCDGLLPNWIKFIDEYMSNGFNGTQAYLAVYKVKSARVASAASARLLGYVSVNEEIQYRLEAQRITDDAVVAETWRIATAAHLRTEKGAGSQVSALRNLSEVKGMIKKDDTLRHVFDSEHLPVIRADYSDKRKKELEEESKKRIVE